jgi:hypothetical protein
MKFFLCTAAFVACTLFASAQILIGDTTFIEEAKQNAIKLYEASLKDQQLYLSGGAYVEPPRTDEQHPYFITDEWQIGSIEFDHHLFNNVYLLYDISSDKVLTESPVGNILSLTEKLSSFKFDKYHFVRIVNESVGNSLPRTGYYEVLYNGKTRVIARHEKDAQEQIESTQLRFYYSPSNRFFVFKNGKYHSVKSKKSILKLLGEQKHALRSFISRNKIRFRKNQSIALARVAEYYDTIISQ